MAIAMSDVQFVRGMKTQHPDIDSVIISDANSVFIGNILQRYDCSVQYLNELSN